MAGSLDAIVEKVRRNTRLVAADDFELSLQRHRGKKHRFENGTLVHESSGEHLWASLRLVHRRQPGRAFTFFQSEESLEDLVDMALESAKRSTADPWFRFPLVKPPPPAEMPPPLVFETPKPLYPELQTAPDRVLEVYETWELESRLFRRDEKIEMGYRVRGDAAKFSLLQRWGDRYGWLSERRGHTRPLTERRAWLEALVDRCFEMARAKPAEGRHQGAWMFSPSVTSALLRRMAGWFCADKVQRGESPLADAEGDWSRGLTIVADGRLPGGARTVPFDCEGTLTQENVLVRDGKRCGWVYDTYTGTRDNRPSTGNCHRGVSDPQPRVRVANLFLRAGQSTPASLVASLPKDAFVLENLDTLEPVEGSSTRVRIGGSGWAVASGKVLGPVEGLRVETDLVEMWRRVTGVGNDLSFYGSYGAPSITVENLP